MHYSSAVNIFWSLFWTYATVRYPQIRRNSDRVASWTAELDIEIFHEFSKIFANVFKGVKVSFFWITIKSEILISFIICTNSTSVYFHCKYVKYILWGNCKALASLFFGIERGLQLLYIYLIRYISDI